MKQVPVSRSVSLFASQNDTESGFAPGQASEQLIKRILDPRDSFSSQIQDIAIEDWAEEDGEEKLYKILNSLEGLESFSWNSTAHIPKSVLDLFHTRFPNARVCVSNISRGREIEGPFDTSMDVELLASPQLYSLEYTILCQKLEEDLSEFSVLTQILLQSKNLRVLRLGCDFDSRLQIKDHQHLYARFGTDGTGPLNLCLKVGDKFPPLEELVLIPPMDKYSKQLYQLSRDHCVALRECMDWTKIRVLDLRRTSSHVFFAELAGHIPNVKSLSFTILNLNVSYQSPGYVQSATVEFLESLTDLEELHINNQSMQYFPKFWPIIQRHAATLQKLSMDVPEDQSGMATVEEPTRAVFRLPYVLSSLRRLSKLPMNAKADTQQSDQEVLYDHSIRLNISFFKMRAFPSLRTLHISLNIPTPSSFQLGLNANTIEKLVETIFCNFFQDNPDSKMEQLGFTVRRILPGSFGDAGLETVVVKVKRSSENVVLKLNEGGYESFAEKNVLSV